MADTLVRADSACANTVNSEIFDELENVSSDLEVLSTFLSATDNFVDELRLATAPDGHSKSDALFRETLHAQVMILRMDQQVDATRSRINDVLAKIAAANRQRRAA